MGASAAPAGTVEKTTVFKEYVPAPAADEQRKKQKRMPLWDFLPTIPLQDWKDLKYEIALYRYHPLTEKKMAVDKIYEYVDPFIIQKKYGGGHFNIYVKEDSQLIYNEDFICEGEPRNAIPGANGNGHESQPPNSQSVTLEALRMMSNPEMMRSMFQMYQMAATESMAMIRAQMPPPQDPLLTLRNAKEILGVGAPKESLLDTIRVLKELGIVGSSEKKGITEILELITTLKGSGLIATTQKPDLASTFLSNLPALADRMVNALHEFRLQSEATERTEILRRGQMRPGDPNVITVQPPASESAVAPGPGAKADTAPVAAITVVDEATAQAVIVQYNLERLVAGIQEPDSTGQDMYDFLINAWPELLPELEQFNKETLLLFFRSPQIQQEKLGNTVLMAVADNPRLPKIIEEFFVVVKRESTATAKA